MEKFKVPHVFIPGTRAKAQEVNENFEACEREMHRIKKNNLQLWHVLLSGIIIGILSTLIAIYTPNLFVQKPNLPTQKDFDKVLTANVPILVQTENAELPELPKGAF